MDIDEYILSRARQMVAKKKKGGRRRMREDEMMEVMEMEGEGRVGDFFKKVGRKVKKFGKSKVGRAIRKVGKKALPAIAGLTATALGQPELAPLVSGATKLAVGGRRMVPARAGRGRRG